MKTISQMLEDIGETHFNEEDMPAKLLELEAMLRGGRSEEEYEARVREVYYYCAYSSNPLALRTDIHMKLWDYLDTLVFMDNRLHNLCSSALSMEKDLTGVEIFDSMERLQEMEDLEKLEFLHAKIQQHLPELYSVTLEEM